MQNKYFKELVTQMDFLLSAALQKCGNVYDAEDLTQEVLLAALTSLAKGNTIQDMRAWLLTVLNRRFNDMLRKKYRQPTVFMGCDFDLADRIAAEKQAEMVVETSEKAWNKAEVAWNEPETAWNKTEKTWNETKEAWNETEVARNETKAAWDETEETWSEAEETQNEAEEAQNVRREVAYLAKIYREVIVRYYMEGQSIAEIAAALGIPEGTVKSRLHFGRERIRKGMDHMEKYTKQSYSPVTLYVTNSGMPGRGGEPASLVNGDLTVQNILWLAYKKPLTIEEISHAIGIPTAYIEPHIRRLVDAELMRQTGTRYYTDFMISTVEDMEKHIPAQKELVHEHFELFWSAIRNGMQKLRETQIYKDCGFDAKNSLELYFAFHCLDYGIYSAFCDIFSAGQIFPDRPDGGQWIAFGSVYFSEFNPQEHMDWMAHRYSGERHTYFDNFAGCRTAQMHGYSAEGFPARSYDCVPEYTFLSPGENFDTVLTQLLCLLKTGTDPESVGFNTEYFKIIPWLEECKILRDENGKPSLNIPVLNRAQAEEVWGLCEEARAEFGKDIKELLAEFFCGKKQKIPAHLDSVPLQKQYLYAENALLFATVREAMKRGELYDGGYDAEEEQPPCPMIFVWEG